MNNFCIACSAETPSSYPEVQRQYLDKDETCCQLCGARGKRCAWDEWYKRTYTYKEMNVHDVTDSVPVSIRK